MRLSVHTETKREILGSLVETKITVDDISLTLVTHISDQVIGARVRGQLQMSPQELAELRFLKRAIFQGAHVLDAGANIGINALVLALTEPTATIYCFEPEPLNFLLLELNIMVNQVTNVHAFNFALGKEKKYVEMYLNPSNYGDHRSFRPTGSILGEESFERLPSLVPMVNPVGFLSEALRENAPDQIHLLKIDTQGPDFEILEACLPLLRSDSIVTVEFSPYHLYQYGTNEDAVFNILSRFEVVERLIPLEQSTERIAVTMAELLAYYRELSNEYKGYWDLVLRHSDPLIAERNRLKDNLTTALSHNVKLETRNAELETRNAELGTRNAVLETRNAELKTRNAEFGTRNAELETRNAELETHNAELETHNAELETRNAELENRLQKEQEEFTILKREQKQLKERVEALEYNPTLALKAKVRRIARRWLPNKYL